jgi:hypothetical protein
MQFTRQPGSREAFAQHRTIGGRNLYAGSPMKLVQRIWYLWGLWDEYCVRRFTEYIAYNPAVDHSVAIEDFAFLMLDPNPKMRITARQLSAFISAPDSYHVGGLW